MADRLAVGQPEDGLGVEHEAVAVEGVLDAPDPLQPLELALTAHRLGAALGDVLEDDHRSLDVRQDERGRAVRHRQVPPVLADEDVGFHPGGDAGLAHRQQGALGGGERRAVGVLVVGGVVDVAPDQLGERPAEEPFGGGVHVGQPSLRVDGEDTLGHVVGHRGQEVPGLAQLALHRAQASQVERHAEVAGHHALVSLAGQGDGAGEDRHHPSSLGGQLEVVRLDGAVRRRRDGGRRRVPGGEHLHGGAAEHLGFRPPEDALGAPAPAPDPELLVRQDHRRPQGVEHGVLALRSPPLVVRLAEIPPGDGELVVHRHRPNGHRPAGRHGVACREVVACERDTGGQRPLEVPRQCRVGEAGADLREQVARQIGTFAADVRCRRVVGHDDGVVGCGPCATGHRRHERERVTHRVGPRADQLSHRGTLPGPGSFAVEAPSALPSCRGDDATGKGSRRPAVNGAAPATAAAPPYPRGYHPPVPQRVPPMAQQVAAAPRG